MLFLGLQFLCSLGAPSLQHRYSSPSFSVVCASAEPSTTAAIGLFESGRTSYMTAPLAESSQLDQ